MPTRIMTHMSDEMGIIIFLAIGFLVVVGIVVVGVLRGRKQAQATTATWTTQLGLIGEQPYLVSSDFDMRNNRQVELFREAHKPGATVTLSQPGEDGEPIVQEVHVSRIGESLRAGWPNAKFGLTVYFSEWEQSEFPQTFTIKDSRKIREIELDVAGISVRDAEGVVVWHSLWESLLFSNGPDMILANGTGQPIHIEYVPGSDLEELIIKYGTLKQMHF